MSFIGVRREACPRPLRKFLLRVLQTRRDDLVSEFVGDAEHEEVADVLDVWVVADPVAPQDVG
jgi:hypothetical protein